MERPLRVGDRVKVPWGLAEQVDGTIVEVWSDPPTHVRVQLSSDDEEPIVVLLSPSVLQAA